MTEVSQQAAEFLENVFEQTGLELRVAVKQGITGEVLDMEGDDAELLQAQTGELLDPHTAIGVKAARECRRSLDIPMVILGTAHPVKFPDAVEKAGVGKALELPAHLSDLFERDERCTVLPNDLKAVQAFVSQHGNRGKPL